MRHKRFVTVLVFFLLFPFIACADTIKPVLNKVLYQTSVEEWVTTQTAEVTVSVNASLNEEKLAKAHGDILNKLSKIAKSDWHITQFNRNPNESGLEQLQVMAQTRLPETALSNLREQAKSVSQPGETFKIETVAFEPTLQEIESTRSQLRGMVYHQVQQELTELNKLYPTQKYVVHTIDFLEGMTPRPRMGGNMAVMDTMAAAAMPVTVANKMRVSAKVVLVSVNQ